MRSPEFLEHLLNTLKNKRRLQLLEIIAKGQFPADRLQLELKKIGFTHSQGTIEAEYIEPLLQTALAAEEYGKYYATAFGRRVSELVKGSEDVEDALPSHSECYEETVLLALLEEPRIYEDFKALVPEKSTARVLSRLQKSTLIETSKDKDYVFFFRTQRDPAKEELSPTEAKTYGSIPDEGISARKLTGRTGISLRRTYKYLRRLKGKKLVFVREKPRTYSLSARGTQIAMMVHSIRDLVSETLTAAAQLECEQKTGGPQMAGTGRAATEDEEKTTENLPPTQYAS